MKELPKVFASPIAKKINNYQEMYRGSKGEYKYNPEEVNKKINKIFASLNHVYKSRVRITLDDKEIEEEIVGKTNMYLLTIDGKKIKITDIIDINLI